ncbi:MAG TPA: hypothetical protein VIN61_16615 [Gammaproteobacteria bacterium]
MIKRISLVAALATVPAAAFGEGHSVAAKAGALGLGVEYGYSINERFAVRFGLNGAEYGFDAEESGIDYDFDLVWDSLSIAADFHPTGGPLRLTVGLLRNDNRLEATSRAADIITVGDEAYTPVEIGTLYGRIGFDDTATFAGIGWDWSRKRNRFGVSFDIGVVDQGAPTVSLRASGPIATDPQFVADLEAERQELQGELDDLDLVPYGSLGFVFRF